MRWWLYFSLCISISLLGATQTCPPDIVSPYSDETSPTPATDLPSYIAEDTVLPIGSLIIPMDSVYQSHKTTATDDTEHSWFNLRSYGYIKELRKANIPVEWIIKNLKAKDDPDIENVDCFPVNPTFLTTGTATRTFAYGPFAVLPQYRASAIAVLSIYQASPRGFNVAVYQTTSTVTVNIRQHLTNRQSVAVSDAGGNAGIHKNYLTMAGFVENVDFREVSNTEILAFHAETCFTILTEPHFSVGDPTIYTEPIREFLNSGGNMLAQCEGIETYESAHFLTTNGIVSDGSTDPLEFPNPMVPYIQIDGGLDEGVGGSVRDFRIAPDGDVISDSFRVAQTIIDPNLMQAMSGKINLQASIAGGVMFYLAGHDYNGFTPDADPTNPAERDSLNGVRMYLNAVTSQTYRPSVCGDIGSFETEVSVDLEDSPDTVLVGSRFDYTITLFNAPCAGTVTNLVAVLDLDPIATFDAADLPADCTYDSMLHEVTCSISAPLEGGESVAYIIPITANVAGDILSDVVAVTNNPETIITNNSDNEVTKAVTSTFTATVDKSGPGIVNPGQQIEYNVDLTNVGDTDMTNMILRDIPTNVEVISANPTAGSFDTSTLEWSIAVLPPGATASLTVIGRIGTDLTSGDVVINEVCLDQIDQASTTGTFPCDTTTASISPIQAIKSADPTTAGVGDTVTYTLEVNNKDTITHTIDLTDTLPSELDFVLGSLYSYTSASFTDTFTADGQDQTTYPSNFPTYDHTLGVYLPVTTAEYEVVGENNFDANKVFVVGGLLNIDSNERDLIGVMIKFSVPPQIYRPTFTITYQATAGLDISLYAYTTEDCTGTPQTVWSVPAAATAGFVQEDIALPVGVFGSAPVCFALLNNERVNPGLLEVDDLVLSYLEISTLPEPQGLPNIATQIDVAPGEQLVWTYEATLNSNALNTDNVINLVELTSSEYMDILNAIAPVAVDRLLQVSKSASVTGAAAGETVQYSLEIENLAPDARDVDLEDVLPSSLVYTPGSISGQHVAHTYTYLTEDFTSTASTQTYPASQFPNPWVEINDDNNWSSGDVFVSGGILTLVGNVALVGFRIPNLDLSDPTIIDVNLIYDYQRTGQTWKLEHYYRVGSGASRPIFPTLPGATGADSNFETHTVSLQEALAFQSSQISLDFIIAETAVASGDVSPIRLDNLRIEIVTRNTNTVALNDPPSIANGFTLNQQDILTVTYDVVVTNPTGSETNTFNAIDQTTATTFSDQYTLETIEAVDDAGETILQQPNTFDVLGNDIGNVNPFTVRIINAPTQGTATVNAQTGEITYTATSYGNDVLTYEVCLQTTPSACSQAQLSIVNQGPPVAEDDNATVNEDEFVVINVLDNDSDPNGDSFTVTSNTDPTNGVISFDTNCQCFTYTPNANYNGPDSFTYETTDSTGLVSNTATVNIVVTPVNDPIVAADDFATTDEDMAVTLNVLSNDPNIDGDPVTVTSTTTPANGSVTFLPDGTVTYTPDPNFNGQDTFQYTIESGGDTSTATVTINVSPVNDPIVAIDDSGTTDEDVAITMNLINNDENVDGDQLTIDSTTTPSNGNVVINGDGTVTYTPNPNFNGQDTFDYTVSSASGDVDTATVTINVTPVNDPLVATNDFATTDEDVAVIIPVLDNDVNIDNDVLTVAIVTPPTNGVVTINPDNTITYTPDANSNGLDSFEYSITGGGDTETATVSIDVISVIDPIVANDDAETTPEDTPVIINVIDNDENVENFVLTISGTTPPSNGSIVVNLDNTITYTPDPNFNGVDVFTYTISGGGFDSTATVTVTVDPVDDPIVANPDSATTAEDTPVNIDIIDNDDNVDNRPLTVSIPVQPTNGVVTINGDNTVTYTPDTNYNGPDSFQYTITSGADSSTTTVDLNVTPVNDPIVANDDFETTDEDTSVLINVIANDEAFDGELLTITSVSTPANGQVTNNGDGTITYTPDPNFNGQDTFTYTIEGGGDTDTATVTVDVTPVNDPIVANPDSDTTPEDTPIIVDVLANDENVDGDALTVSVNMQPANGVAAVQPDGTIRYTPNANFNGQDIFEYTITSAGGDTATTTVTIDVTSVNDPIDAMDDSANTPEDTPVVIPVLSNDVDVDNEVLTITSTTSPSNGNILVNGDGTITYTPNTNFNGQDTFTYTIESTGGDTDTATVTVIVTAAGDTVTAIDDSASTVEDSPGVNIPVLDNDVNPDGGPLTVTVTNAPTNGSTVVNGDGTITYIPDPDFNGQDTFEYTIEDQNGATDTAIVTVNVTPVNDPIVAVDDAATTPEDTPVNIPVLDNDENIDNDGLVVISATSPSNGVVRINGGNDITYTPNANFNGQDTFTYTISSGSGDEATATVVVDVTPVNDPIFAVDDSETTPEDTPVVIDVLDNDIDVDNEVLTVTIISRPSNGSAVVNNGGSVTYTPDANFNGQDTFIYEITSPSGDVDNAVVTIDVTPVNDPIVANPDADTTPEDTPITVDVLANDVNVDADQLIVSINSTPSNGAVVVNADETITYTPNANFNGRDTFTYTITSSENGDTATTTVTIDVTSVNDPIVAVDDFESTNEDTPIPIRVLDNDINVDNDAITITGTTTPANGQIAINGHIITYTPDPNFNGQDTFTYTIEGGGDSSTATVTVDVIPVNDPIVANPDADTTPEDTPITVNVLSNDENIDGDVLSVTSTTSPSNGVVSINGDGTITYTPNANFNGQDTFTYTITSAGGDTATTTVTIDVTPVNDPIVANDDFETTNEDTPVTVDVLDNDEDVDGDALSVSILANPTNGSVIVNGDGTIRYTPNANFNGDDTFRYEITSPTGDVSDALVTITVLPVNDPITAVDDSSTTNEDVPVTIDVLSNDINVDNDGLIVSSTTAPANGSVTNNGDGTVTYTPDQDFNGVDTFTYTVTSDSGDTSTATVTVNVTPVDDPIVANDDATTTPEDTRVNIVVVSNDENVDNNPLTVSIASSPSNGVASVRPDGSINYTPNANFNGQDTFEYTITTPQGDSSTALVTVDVTPVNDPVDAINDSASTPEDNSVTIPVLDNDINVDGDALTVTIEVDPTNGSAVVNPDGTVTYTPISNFNGNDSFQYTITSDGGDVDTATVNIVVFAVGDPVTAVDDTSTTPEEVPVVINAIANDVNPGNEVLIVDLVSGPSNGSVTNHLDGTFTYTPDVDFNGQDSFDYSITTPTGSTDTATVTITVTPVDDPIVANDDTTTTDEDTPVEIFVLQNDVNPDDDEILVISVTSPPNGSVVIVDGTSVIYTPSPNFNGVDSFTYTITSDTGNTDSATVTVNVLSVNDPIIAVDDTATTLEDTDVTIDIIDNDENNDGDVLTVAIVTPPTNGTVTLNPDNTVTYSPDPNFNGQDTFEYSISGGGDTDTATVTVDVTPVNDPIVANPDSETTDEDTPIIVNVLANDENVDGDAMSVTSITSPSNGVVSVNGDGTITYTPNANFNGQDIFTYTITSAGGDTATTTVTIDVTPVNDPIVANDDFETTNEDTPVTVAILDNDENIDGDVLTITSISTPVNGQVTDNGDGTITYTPTANFNGQDTFTYTIEGGGDFSTATVTVDVLPVNDPIVANPDFVATPENTPTNIDVMANDENVDGDAMFVSISAQPSNGAVVVQPDGTITYTPNNNFSGQDTFQYTLTSAGGDTSVTTVSINVSSVNNPIDAMDDATTTREDTPVEINVLGNDENIDNDGLLVDSVTQPTNGQVIINNNGTVTYIPNANFHGVDTFEYTAISGGGDTDTATVTVTVISVNDPIIAHPDFATTPEDTPVTIHVTANDENVDNDALTVALASSPANGSVTVHGDGSVTYTPNLNFNGQDTFTYSITSASGDFDVTTVTVDVTPVDDPIVATDDNTFTPEDTPVNIPVTNNDFNVDNDVLTVAIVTPPTNGAVVINPDNTITYTPDANFHGQDTFEYSISGGGDTDTATVTVNVLPVNDPIVANPDSDTTPEDTPVTVNVLANDENVDGDAMSVTSTTSPSNGSVVINGDGTIRYTPNANFNGQDTFTYTITSAGGDTATTTVTIDVLPVNDPIVANPDADTTPEDTPVTVDVLANDENVDGDVLTIIGTTNPSEGSIVVNADNTITYTPNSNFNGQDQFTYTIASAGGDTDTTTVTITITPDDDGINAVNDDDTTPEDTPVTIDILSNDGNVDGEPLTVFIEQQPSNGSVQINQDGTVVYTPNPNFNGIDTFVYSITTPNGDHRSTATVTVTVTPVEDEIVAVDDSASTSTTAPVTISVLDNDTNFDGVVLTVTAENPTHGSVVVNLDGTVTYTPNGDFNGIDTFDYTITSPSGQTSTATVSVTVSGNNPPIAGDDTLIALAGESASIDLLDNDSDPDGDDLTVNIIRFPSFGTLSTDPSGNIIYTPNPGFTGLDSFDYEICDPVGACDTATVSIDVLGNLPPVAENDFVVSEDFNAVIVDVLANDFDPEGEQLTVSFVELPEFGTLTLNPDGTVTYEPDPNIFVNIVEFEYEISDPSGLTDTAQVVITFGNSNPIANDDTFILQQGETIELSLLENDFDIDGDEIFINDYIEPLIGTLTFNEEDNTLSYTADNDFTGTVTFVYEISDGNGGRADATVTILIPLEPSINASNDVAVTRGDNPVDIDVLSNDLSSPSGLDIDSLIISTPPSHGFVTVDDDGMVTYIAQDDYFGADTFEYQICSLDGVCDTASVTVFIFPTLPVGTASPTPSPFPLASPTVQVPSPSRSPAGPVISTNPLPPVPSVKPSPSVAPSATPGTIIATPDFVSVPEDTSEVVIHVLDNDVGLIDPNTLVVIIPPENGVAVVNGADIIYYPTPGFVGFDSFEYQVCSFQGICSQAIVTVEVFEVYEIEFSSSSNSSDNDSWCVGGFVLWIVASVIGFAGAYVSNNGWFLLFLMQIIAVTGQLGISYPQFYSDFASCFGWTVLDIPLPWEIDGFTVLVDGLGGHGRLLLDFDSWVDVIDVAPEDLLWTNLFWTMIALVFVMVVMLIVFVVVIILQYGVIRSSAHEQLVDEQGGTGKSLVLEALEHFMRAWLIFVQLVYFGLILTSFVIIGYYFRNSATTNLIAPFIISIIIAVLGLIWLIAVSVIYFFYRARRWNNIHVIRVLGFFYLHYRSSMGWWNSICLARIYLISASVGFFLGWGAVQLSLLLAIFIGYGILLIIFRPYQQKAPAIIDLFLTFAIIVVLVLLFIAWGIGSDSEAAEWIFRVVIWLFWIYIVVFFIFIVFYLLFILVSWFRIRRNCDNEEQKDWDFRFLMYGLGGKRMERRQQQVRGTELGDMS